VSYAPIASTMDPDGREVVYDERARGHIERRRPDLIDQIEAIIAAITRPDHREDDPLPGRERFYARRVTDKVRWLRVVVDFNETPAFVVTALIQRKNPVRDQ
jgi:hypothetical protein